MTRGNMARAGTRPAPLKLRLLLLALSSLLALAMVETAVRVRQWVRFGSGGTSLYASTVDPVSGLTIPVAGDTTASIRINSLGFRGPELTPVKRPGQIRLAFLGASTTFCAEVSSNELAWPHLVWLGLQQAIRDVDFDYVNGAFPGYAVESSRRNLRHRVRPLQPDVIVIYEGVNDLSRDARLLAEQQGIVRGNVDDQHLLGRWSLTWSLLEKNVRLLARQRGAASDTARRLEFDPGELSLGFRARLESLIREAQEVAPVVAVATISQKVRAGQPPAEQLRNSSTHLYYMPFLAVSDFARAFDEYNRVIREAAAATGAVLIEGEHDIPADDVHFRDSVHFSDAGSRAMADRVTAALLASPQMRGLADGARSRRPLQQASVQ